MQQQQQHKRFWNRPSSSLRSGIDPELKQWRRDRVVELQRFICDGVLSNVAKKDGCLAHLLGELDQHPDLIRGVFDASLIGFEKKIGTDSGLEKSIGMFPRRTIHSEPNFDINGIDASNVATAPSYCSTIDTQPNFSIEPGSASEHKPSQTNDARFTFSEYGDDRCPDGGFAIYLGGLDAALSFSELRALGITAIINMASTGCVEKCNCMWEAGLRSQFQSGEKPHFEPRYYQKHVSKDFIMLNSDARDHTSYDITTHFDECFEFLDRCRREGRKVLVHCVAGINRSAAIVVAYMCDRYKIDLESCVKMVAARRIDILSNRRFLIDLIDLYDPMREAARLRFET